MNNKIYVIQDILSGDSGKGKVASVFAEDFDLHVKFNGGANAGHTVQIGGERKKLHYLTAGSLYGKTTLFGTTTYIQPDKFLEEVQQSKGKIYLSTRAHLVLPSDIKRNQEEEQKKPIGTTSRGIGPCAGRKWSYSGIRVIDLKYLDKFVDRIGWEDYEYLRKYKDDLLQYAVSADKLFDQYNQEGANILFEGNQGLLLDVDWGTYPFVSASHMGLPAVFSSVNRYFDISKTLLVMKSYISHLTPTPFPTDMETKDQNIVRDLTGEFGTTTGRPRHLGWLDLLAIQNLNLQFPNAEIFLTHGDSFEKIKEALGYYKISVGYKESSKFPESLYEERTPIYQNIDSIDELTNLIEQFTKVPVRYISLGPEKENYVEYSTII